MPATRSGFDGAQPIRHRVAAADASANGSTPTRRHLRNSKTGTPVSPAASWRRRVATIDARRTSATTAAGEPSRTVSSTTAKSWASFRGSAKITLAGASPACSSPGAYRSNLVDAHRTGALDAAANRAPIPAMNRVAAASSASDMVEPVISCRPPIERPPAASRSSIVAIPNGSTPWSAADSTMLATRVRRSAIWSGEAGRADMDSEILLFPLCSSASQHSSTSFRCGPEPIGRTAGVRGGQRHANGFTTGLVSGRLGAVCSGRLGVCSS